MKSINLPLTRFEVTKEFLNEKIQEGINELFNGSLDSEHGLYLREELKMLEKAPKEWTSYFLITSDMIKEVRKENPNAVAGGLGHICGSFIAYLLKLTSVDPILYKLSFFQFYSNISIIPVPTIDFYMSSKARISAIKCLQKEYGALNVWIPCLRSKNNKIGVHSTAVVISPEELTDYTIINFKEEEIPVSNMITKEVEEAGFIKLNLIVLDVLNKIDILASKSHLKTVAKIPNPFSLSRSDIRAIFKNANIYLEDSIKINIYDYFVNSMDTYIDGIAFVSKYRRTNLMKLDKADIWTMLNAKNVFKEDTIKELLPNILNSTYYEILYQEQVTDILSLLLEIDKEKANIARKEIAKRHFDKIRYYYGAIVDNLLSKNINPDKINIIWHEIYRSNNFTTSRNYLAGSALIDYWEAYLDYIN